VPCWRAQLTTLILKKRNCATFFFFPLDFYFSIAAAEANFEQWDAVCPAGAYRNACMWDPAHQRGRQQKKERKKKKDLLTGNLKANTKLASVE